MPSGWQSRRGQRGAGPDRAKFGEFPVRALAVPFAHVVDIFDVNQSKRSDDVNNLPAQLEHIYFGLKGPMSVSLDLVTAISSAVAAEVGLGVQLITVASANAEAHRVELLVTLARPSFEPRRVLLNLSRKEPAAFERQLRVKLYEIWNPVRPALGLVARSPLD